MGVALDWIGVNGGGNRREYLPLFWIVHPETPEVEVAGIGKHRRNKGIRFLLRSIPNRT